ncbi:hypothetical protein Southeast_033 [Staphylococcus phage Southeast]|nr:hypothetical protein Southeast_033 [Staphylococcus phage Southeast]
MREKIEAVINSDLSGYAIEKHCKTVSQNTVSSLRTGKYETVINSDLSGYAIEKHCKTVSQNTVSSLRTGKYEIDNLRFKTCEELSKVYDDLIK